MHCTHLITTKVILWQQIVRQRGLITTTRVPTLFWTQVQARLSTAMHCGCPTGQRTRASTLRSLYLADWSCRWPTRRQAPQICWWYTVICRDDWQRLSRPALALHPLSPALVSVQSSASQRKQVGRHYYWDSSTSCSGAAAGTFACRWEFCVAVSDSLKLLGARLDRTMSFDKHVSTVVHACNFRL